MDPMRHDMMCDQGKSMARADRRRFGSRGFSMIELMVVIAVIAILVSLVVVGGSRIRAIADNKQAKQVLVSIKTGLEQFHETYGYYPPLLDDSGQSTGGLLSVIQKETDFRDVSFYSTLTLVPYLIGVGDINLDGVPDLTGIGDNNDDDGLSGEGFRDPGRDHSWGGAIKAENRSKYWKAYNNASSDGKTLTGKVTKRLVELDESLKPAIDRQGLPIKDRYLFQLTDIWEVPIRYYTGWDAKETELDSEDDLPVYWPKEWFESTPVESRSSLVSQLRSAPYVLMSAGRDRLARPESLDGDEATAENDKDNLLEIGE